VTDPEELERAEHDAAAEAEATTDAAVADPAVADSALDRQALLDNDESDEGPSSADYSIAFSPRNVAVGLAIVAGLVAFVASRRRRRRRDA
jgi:hypothetical protein